MVFKCEINFPVSNQISDVRFYGYRQWYEQKTCTRKQLHSTFTRSGANHPFSFCRQQSKNFQSQLHIEFGRILVSKSLEDLVLILYSLGCNYAFFSLLFNLILFYLEIFVLKIECIIIYEISLRYFQKQVGKTIDLSA